MGDLGTLGERVAVNTERIDDNDKRHAAFEKQLMAIDVWNKQVYAELYVLKIGGRIAMIILPIIGAGVGILLKHFMEHWVK